jgi:DNA integrity scanning protein DisA with diadenylate cyclase activity
MWGPEKSGQSDSASAYRRRVGTRHASALGHAGAMYYLALMVSETHNRLNAARFGPLFRRTGFA